jgi:hypothetical protein
VNEDFKDFLVCLLGAEARFLIVGAHALAVQGVPRATGDLDIWIDASPENVAKVWAALESFGSPAPALGVSDRDLTVPGTVVQIGLPPRRIDVLTSITGVTFEDAWARREMHPIDDETMPFIGREDFIINKRATGRLRDLADIEALGEKP